MAKYICLSVFVLLNARCIMSQMEPKNGTSAEVSACPRCPACNFDYAVVILAVIILFLMMLTFFLSYALYKTKSNTYRKSITTNTHTTIGKVDHNVRQDSSGVSEFGTLRKINTTDSPFRRNETALTMVSEMGVNDRLETNCIPQTVNPSQLEPKPIVPINKRNYPVQALIRPDQMQKICKDVLSKMSRNESMSLTHLNEFLNEETKKSESKLSANDKCASLPVIDDYVNMQECEYDVLPPRPVPLSSHNSSAEMVNTVYDCIPATSNLVIDDADGVYLMPRSIEGPFKEPSYVNAKNRKSTTSISQNEEIIISVL